MASLGILCDICPSLRNNICTYRTNQKKKPQYKNSQPTDWTFLVLLNLTALTGILVHFGRLLDWPMTTYILYVVHMMIAVPMLVLEVPFTKWAHLMFRPVALYSVSLKEKYINQQEEGV